MRTRKGREPEYVRRLAGESTPKSGEPQRAQREAGRPAAVQVASLPASHRSAAPSWLNSQISVQSSVFRSTTGSAAARAGATSGLPGAAHVVRARRAEANESTQRAGFRRSDARSIRRGNGAVANSRFMATAAGDRCRRTRNPNWSTAGRAAGRWAVRSPTRGSVTQGGSRCSDSRIRQTGLGRQPTLVAQQVFTTTCLAEDFVTPT